MAIRRLLFPEATVSQSASYCLTAGLWRRAQTLSPTPSAPPPPPSLSSLLVLRAIIFIWKPKRGFREKRDKRTRTSEEERRTERRSKAREENCDSSEAVIDATSVCLQCTLPEKGGLYWFAPAFQSKKSGFSTPDFPSLRRKLPASLKIKHKLPKVKLKHIETLHFVMQRQLKTCLCASLGHF